MSKIAIIAFRFPPARQSVSPIALTRALQTRSNEGEMVYPGSKVDHQDQGHQQLARERKHRQE